MTEDEIIKLAREAGFWQEHFNTWMCSSADIERFVALVEAKSSAAAKAEEREACARVCEKDDSMRWSGAANAIRARGQA